MPPPILILAALQIEARAIARALRLTPAGKFTWHSPAASKLTDLSVNSPRIALHLIGLRASRLPTPLPPASHVLLAGLAGGLDPALRPNDVLLDSDPPLSIPSLRTGTIHTAAQIVCTPADKAALFAQTGAAVVDMETAQVRQAARAAGVAFLCLRVVLDDAACSLPSYLPALTDDLGRPRPLSIGSRLLRRPRAIVELSRLGRQTTAALAALTSALGGLLDVLAAP